MKISQEDPYLEKLELERKLRKLVDELREKRVHERMTVIFAKYSNGYIYNCNDARFIFETRENTGRFISFENTNGKQELIYHQTGDLRGDRYKLLCCKKLDTWYPIVLEIYTRIKEEERKNTEEKHRREIEELKNNFDF